MWHRIAAFIINFRVTLLLLLLLATVAMGYFALKVELSYEFSRAVPTDNPKYIAYQDFRKQFGEDGNLMVIGVQDEMFFRDDHFSAYRDLVHAIEKVPGVLNVLSVPTSKQLIKDTSSGELLAASIPADTTVCLLYTSPSPTRH